MAVIGKIRQRAGLAIAVVGASLLAFILGDLLTSNRSFLGSETNVAVIGGHKVKVQDFEARIQKLENIYRLNNEGRTVDQETMNQLREQAWNQLLNDEIIVRQLDKAGIVVSEEELFDMVQGKNIHAQIKQAFTDPQTGQFNAANVVQFLKNMDNDATGKTRAQWLAFESGIRLERANDKYNNLIKNGFYATMEEGRRLYDNTSRRVTLKYIRVPYTDIPDSTVKPADDRLQRYYDEHREEYKQEASRHVEYVVFDVLPSEDDRRAAHDYIDRLVEPFRSAENDSAFVRLNADTKPDFKYARRGTLSPRLDSVVFDAEIGTVIGPYEENGYVRLAKVTGRKTTPDSIQVSHALVAYTGAERAPQGVTRTAEQARAMADSLLGLCAGNAEEFLRIARTVSDDAVASQKDGDLGWITEESPMDPRFLAGAFDIPKGEVKVVESGFGFHLIKVFETGAPSEKVQVMVVDRMIEPGSKTYQTIFARANEFAGRNNTAELFDKACEEQGLNKRVLESLSENDNSVPGLESAREMVRWAFGAKKGDVSKAFEFGEKFVVAKLVDVKEKGIAPLEQVRDQVTTAVIKDMKAEELIKRFGDDRNLQSLATKLNQTVQVVDNVAFSSNYVSNLGMEPQMVGWSSVLAKGEVSPPFKGESGVFMIEVESITEPAEKTDFSEDRKSKINILESRASFEIFNALKDKAKIEDNRGKFY